MNVTDYQHKVEEIRNRLYTEYDGNTLQMIYERQKELMEKYDKIEERNGCLQTDECPVNINGHGGQQRLKDMTWRCVEELGEAMNCLKNKPWKQTMMETDVQHYREEIADAFHFFIELCILSDISSNELFMMYFLKSEVNKFRQDSKY